MAQQSNYPPRTFSPPQSTPSASIPSSSGAFPPPSKRQRLSPISQSLYESSAESPSFTNVPLPIASQQPQSNASMAVTSGAGAMGPPSKPVEKATDTADLADVLASSGIDIRDEEAALTHSYYNSSSQPAVNGSHPANNASSFDSTSSSGSHSAPVSASTSFSNLSQPTHPAQRAVNDNSLLRQQSAPSQFGAGEQFERQESRDATRGLNEFRQYHLNDPFLKGNTLRHHLALRAYETGVTWPVDGLLDKQVDDHQNGRVAAHTITGSNGQQVVAARAALLDKGAALSDILALLSLAAEERLRGLIEDAAALAKGRRIGSQGVVPAEWSDLALINGAHPTSATVTSNRNGGDSAVSPMSIPLKRSHSTANLLPTPVSDRAKSPGANVTFPNHTAQTLRNLAQAEFVHEEARLARRARRTAGGPTSADGSKLSTSGSGSGERAPEVDVKRMTKKERNQTSTKESEAYAHTEANKTANRMLGGGGGLFGKKKEYAWMKPAAGPGTSTPSRLNTAVGGSSAADVSGAAAASALLMTGKRIGEWREDRERGAGIQMRDWVSVLEADGKEKKSLARAYSRLKSRE